MKINLEPETSKIKNRHVQDILARRQPAMLGLEVEMNPCVFIIVAVRDK